MPGDATASHNGRTIHFTEADHTYIDDCGIEYTSVTTLIHRAFPVFDAEAVAARCAAERGTTAEALREAWRKNGEESSLSGTRMHENCEYQILGQFDKLHAPKDEAERIRFCNAWSEVEFLQSGTRFIEPEKLVFSPRFRVAGSIDLFGALWSGEIFIGDWKLLKELKRSSFNNERGTWISSCTIPNANFHLYALQLSLYDLLLRHERYIAPDVPAVRRLHACDRATGIFSRVEVPDYRMFGAQLLLEHVSGVYDFETIPF